MPRTPEQQAAYDKIADLIKKFESNLDEIKKNQNETETRIQFINPFFQALGWDIDNTIRNAPVTQRDVVHEDKVMVDGKMKSPDYSFRIGNKPKFFLEAKKPSVFIKMDYKPAYQLRRYGWSAGLAVSVLTDFEEFALYDCTKPPKEIDDAKTCRLKYLTYDQYLENFDWLWQLLSREEVEKGSLERFAEVDKKGSERVDTAFLQSLEGWRNLLASNIALRNKQLNDEQINFFVQTNLNRIVFWRNCEDRRIEPYEKMKACVQTAKTEGDYFRSLYALFKEANEKYNAGLFDLSKDTLSETVSVSNDTIWTIINELYHPKSPYEFSVIGAEILGTAYERFLGKEIKLTKGRKIVVEEKPDVRKAGGVFYTPQYIVEYIVKNTVGKLIENKTPEEIAEITICDPACGSGSFLLGAYGYLLDYHVDWYNLEKAQGKKKYKVKDNPLTPDGKLTTKVKKQILLNNIFGVDLDSQAVEVTKLSLLMKCLEEETLSSLALTLSFERALPNLDNNIKSGNSLVDFDIYEGQMNIVEKKIKPFNWKANFPKVFKRGGFDAVIGNPPWSSKIPNELNDYISAKYTADAKNLNLFAPFVSLGISKLMSDKGLFGMLIPKVFIKNTSYTPIRKQIFEDYHLVKAIDFGKFPHVASDCVCPIIGKIKTEYTELISFSTQKIEISKIPTELFQKSPIFAISFDLNEIQTNLLSKITSINKKLAEISQIKRGIELGQKADITECSHCGTWNETGTKYYNTKTDKKCKKCHLKLDFKKVICISNEKKVSSHKLACISGRDISQYSINHRYFIVNDLQGIDYKNNIFQGDRIYLKRIAEFPQAVWVDKSQALLAFNTIYSIFNTRIDSKYLTAIINSKLIRYFYDKTFNLGMSLTTQITIEFLKQLPIKTLDLKNKSEKKQHDEIIKLVDSLLKLNADLQIEKDKRKKEILQGRIAYSEQRINEIVYELYGLTKEEIAIIEQS